MVSEQEIRSKASKNAKKSKKGKGKGNLKDSVEEDEEEGFRKVAQTRPKAWLRKMAE
jgi:hypothetical protein